MVDIKQAIEDAITNPASVTVDGQNVTARKPSELRELLNLLREEELRQSGDLGIRFVPMKPVAR